jgi:hypothetical protein
MLRKNAIKIIRNPWVWFFGITAAFQVFRGSFSDTVIFGLGGALVAIAASGAVNRDFLSRHQVQLTASLPVAIGLALALSLLPRHSAIHAAIFIAILPLVIALVWHRDSGERVKPNAEEKRARSLWATLGVGTCVWELGANILGQLNNTLTDYPTLSVLIDPSLDTILGQGIFVTLWLAAGWGFLRLGIRK